MPWSDLDIRANKVRPWFLSWQLMVTVLVLLVLVFLFLYFCTCIFICTW